MMTASLIPTPTGNDDEHLFDVRLVMLLIIPFLWPLY